MSGSFEVRVIEPESRSVETGTFDVEPELDHAAQVVGLMRQFMGGRPAQFRQPLPFMNQGEWELDWNAAAGGAAFASFHEGGQPLSLGVLLSGRVHEADAGMLSGFEQAVLGPILGPIEPEARDQLMGGEGPRLIILLLPGRPELRPAVHLLNAALAAAFFRAVGVAEAS
ncbi:MAG: hypothetical protein KJZ84_01370 [Bryobacteraceae bacterium]|nr:hypothetical protein [Bryobacteraceae bacterium]